MLLDRRPPEKKLSQKGKKTGPACAVNTLHILQNEKRDIRVENSNEVDAFSLCILDLRPASEYNVACADYPRRLLEPKQRSP